jgi:hypothetical protein
VDHHEERSWRAHQREEAQARRRAASKQAARLAMKQAHEPERPMAAAAARARGSRPTPTKSAPDPESPANGSERSQKMERARLGAGDASRAAHQLMELTRNGDVHPETVSNVLALDRRALVHDDKTSPSSKTAALNARLVEQLGRNVDERHEEIRARGDRDLAEDHQAWLDEQGISVDDLAAAIEALDDETAAALFDTLEDFYDLDGGASAEGGGEGPDDGGEE